MIIHRVPQGSRAWLDLRAGLPSASEMDSIITPGGKSSTSAERYMNELLAERVMGHPRVGAVTLWMKRGTEMEEKARKFFEFTRDVTVEEVGFITDDLVRYGASPDGMVGDDGLVEIKCPSEGIHLGYLLSQQGASVDKAYRVQTQAQLFVTGRQYVDIISFHPEMPEALFRVERDEKFIELLSEKVIAFSEELEKKAAELTERGLIKPKLSPTEESATRSGVSQFIGDEEMAWALSRKYDTE